MASCLQVENLTKSYGEQVLFENISFTIEEGRRVALVAKNGTGKTTLLNIIAGKESHDAGSVVPRRGLRIAYLEQSPAYPAGMTVLEACFHSESPALKAIAEYERAIGDASGEGLQEAMARMDALEAWDYEQRAKRILSRLKIRDFGQKVETLSGGQLKRVALANVLISESDLLILDDLGTELMTSFVHSAMYQIVNTRLITGKKTVISTNLSPDELGRRYGAPVLSRLQGEYQMLLFFGEDIRRQKRK